MAIEQQLPKRRNDSHRSRRTHSTLHTSGTSPFPARTHRRVSSITTAPSVRSMLQQERHPERERGPSFFSRLVRRADGCDVKILFDRKALADRVSVDDMQNQTSERLHLYLADEAVKGRVVLTPTGNSYSHSGVSVQLIGTVAVFNDGERRTEFLRQERQFEAATINAPSAFDFEFTAPKPYESYRGINARVVYMVRATIFRTLKNISAKEEIWVSDVSDEDPTPPTTTTTTTTTTARATAVEAAAAAQEGEDKEEGGAATAAAAPLVETARKAAYFRETVFGPQSTAMDVGVDNVLHIEFRYAKTRYHFNERVLGQVTFKVTDMDIQYGEVGIVRKEYIGAGHAEDPFEVETLQAFEIMDGTPIVGEVVPIRLYLGCIPRLTPTYANVNHCFRVRYFLNLVLVTSVGKRYFKQQEITLYRKEGQERPASLQPLKSA